jgi:multicomponent Na+:H+ antiporter subunit B
MILTLIDIVLLFFLAVTAIAVIRLSDLFAAVMLFGIYSLLSAAIFVSLDAVDVAFTEAAVGAGISTILALSTLALTARHEKKSDHTPLIPILACVLTGAALIYGTFDMPKFGDPEAPIHQHVAPHYLEKSGEEIGLPNVVTSVLASYRAFDTFGEVVVVFTAAVGVLLLISGRPKRKKIEKAVESEEAKKEKSEEAQQGEAKL